LDYGYLHEKLHEADKSKREENEEKFTDFLNFFEFIGILYVERNLTFEHVYEVFDYYLKKIKDDDDCQDWIKRYSFEKLKALLKKV
jgi:CRISPR/Cas system CSM-associated protein Csm2 small subunit